MDRFVEVLFVFIGIDYFKKIVCLKSDYIWVSNYYVIVLFFDFNKKKQINLISFGGSLYKEIYEIVVFKSGELVFSCF